MENLIQKVLTIINAIKIIKILRLKHCITGFIITSTLLMFFIGYFSKIRTVENDNFTSSIKRVCQKAKDIALFNEKFIINKQYDLMNLKPVTSDKNNSYCYIVDTDLMVVSPNTKDIHKVECKELKKVIKEKDHPVVINKFKNNEYLFFHPIVKDNKTIAAVIMDYKIDWKSKPNFPLLKFTVVMAIIFFMAYIFSESLSLSMNQLTQEIPLAIKRNNNLDIDIPYMELNKLKQSLNCLISITKD